MAEFIKKTVLRDTLKTMKIGEEIKIEPKTARPMNVRIAAFRLKDEGYSFFCTERNMITGISVRRDA